MSRNTKILGLALVAMLVAAPGALGASFDAPSGHTTVTASQEVKWEHTFKVTHGAVTCETATFTGTASGNGLASTSFSAAYGICLFAGVQAHVVMNGCAYKLYAAGTADVVCPAGSEITVTTLGTSKCTVHIPAQTGLKTVTYTNIGAVSPTKEVTSNAAISGIKYSQTEGTGLGKCLTAHNHATGTFTGKALATGEALGESLPHRDIIWTA